VRLDYIKFLLFRLFRVFTVFNVRGVPTPGVRDLKDVFGDVEKCVEIRWEGRKMKFHGWKGGEKTCEIGVAIL